MQYLPKISYLFMYNSKLKLVEEKMNNLDHFGLFWIPSAPDLKVPGLLQFKDDGPVTLRLMMAHYEVETDRKTILYPQYQQFDLRIFGEFIPNDRIDAKRRLVTVENAHEISRERNSISYNAERILLDIHAKKEERWSGVTVKFDENVEAWLAEPQIENMNFLLPFNSDPYTITLNCPSDEKYITKERRLSVSWGRSKYANRGTSAKIDLLAFIKIEYFEPMPTEYILQDILNLRILLSISIENPIEIESVFLSPINTRTSSKEITEMDQVHILQTINAFSESILKWKKASPDINPAIAYENLGIAGMVNWLEFIDKRKLRGKVEYLNRRNFHVLFSHEELVSNLAVIESLANFGNRGKRISIRKSLQMAKQKTMNCYNGLINYDDCCWCEEVATARGEQGAHFEEKINIPYLHRLATETYYLAVAYLLKEFGIMDDTDDIVHRHILFNYSNHAYPEIDKKHRWHKKEIKCEFCGTTKSFEDK